MAWHFSRKKKDMPDGLWMRCDECGATVYKKDVENSLRVCPDCGFHFPLDSAQRIAMTLDPWSFEELFTDLAPQDPLGFVDREAYKDRLTRYSEQTGLKDAMVAGTGTIAGWRVAFGVLDTRFMMGSLGSVMGEKIYRLAEVAARERIPMILVCGSGGARMQEGLIALMQMVKTSAAIALCQLRDRDGHHHRRARRPHWLHGPARHRRDDQAETARGLSEKRVHARARAGRHGRAAFGDSGDAHRVD